MCNYNKEKVGENPQFQSPGTEAKTFSFTKVITLVHDLDLAKS